MFTGKVTAGPDGKFQLSSGFQVAFQPASGEAVFPLTLLVNGQVGQQVEVNDSRPLQRPLWNSLTVLSKPGAEWFIHMATEAGDELSNHPAAFQAPVRLASMLLRGTLTNGNYYFDGAGGFAKNVPKRFDVRRFRGVLCTLTAESWGSMTASSVGLFLDHFPSESGNAFGEELAAGTVNDVSGGEAFARIHVGETTENAEGEQYSNWKDRVLYVEPYVHVPDGAAEPDGDVIAELWGLP